MEQQKRSKEELKAVDINNAEICYVLTFLYEELNLRNLIKREWYHLG
jgi:hypothetical protein